MSDIIRLLPDAIANQINSARYAERRREIDAWCNQDGVAISAGADASL